MNQSSNKFCDNIVSDLIEFSRELISPGLSPAKDFVKGRVAGVTTSSQTFAVHRLVHRIPTLLEDADMDEAAGAIITIIRPYARTAHSAMQPSRYGKMDGNIVPVAWRNTIPSGAPAVAPLRWLLDIIDRQTNAIVKTKVRLEKQIEEAWHARKGTSKYALDDANALKAAIIPVVSALKSLETARNKVVSFSGIHLTPSSRIPNPFPTSPVWRAFAMEVRTLLSPEDALPDFVGELLSDPIAAADVPYLYQRWVGLKIVEAFKNLQWKVPENAAGVLFLGGEAIFRCHGVELSLWVEPRLEPNKNHPSGFNAVSTTEKAPDFLITTPGYLGDDAFVLDATLSTYDEILYSKGKYLESVMGDSPLLIGGAGLPRFPLRSWAVSPVREMLCYDVVGKLGAIPAHPILGDFEHLQKWIADVSQHALAWGIHNRAAV